MTPEGALKTWGGLSVSCKDVLSTGDIIEYETALDTDVLAFVIANAPILSPSSPFNSFDLGYRCKEARVWTLDSSHYVIVIVLRL